jgi:hypothetical protein
VLVYHNGTGTMQMDHADAGPSGNSSRVFNLGDADQTFGERGSFMIQANGSAGWRSFAYTR